MLLPLPAACGESTRQQVPFRILSGSENATLEPLIQRFAEETDQAIAVEQAGSVDILIDNSGRLIDALRDRELQRLAWEEHGFRSGLLGLQNDPAVLDVAGVPETVQGVIPLPIPAVMDETVAAVSAGGPPAVPACNPPRPATPTVTPRTNRRTGRERGMVSIVGASSKKG